jgi:hypothetical protein
MGYGLGLIHSQQVRTDSQSTYIIISIILLNSQHRTLRKLATVTGDTTDARRRQHWNRCGEYGSTDAGNAADMTATCRLAVSTLVLSHASSTPWAGVGFRSRMQPLPTVGVFEREVPRGAATKVVV